MASQNPNVNNLADIVRAMYPDILTKTYSVPPMYLNQVAYHRQMVPGITNLPALVLQPPLVAGDAAPTHDLTPDSLQPMASAPCNLWTPEPLSNRPKGPKPVLQTDVNDDTAQAQVLRNLQVLGESRQESMFIISQLNFSEYLNDPALVASTAHLPAMPVDPNTGRKREGDFDILVIHRQFGILIGELKTVGKDMTSRTDAVMTKTVQKALKQLNKLKDVMTHLVSDVAAPGLTVRGTLFLPFVSAQQLQRILLADPQLEQDACRTLGVANGKTAAQVCCCSDNLSDPTSWWNITPAVINQLSTWWEDRMDHPDSVMTDHIYEEVVARFVGPATSVLVNCSTAPRLCVKTEDEAVAHLGHVLSTLVLTPEQVDILELFSRSLLPPLIYLSGPPGTGKTVMLTLVGLYQLRKGEDVHIISGHAESRAASRLINNQMESTLSADSSSAAGCGKVFLHDYYLFNESEKDRAVGELTKLGPDVFLIFDELTRGFGVPGDPPRYFPALLSELMAQVPNLTVWTASVPHSKAPPELHEIPLTTPLRCAPSILREVQEEIASRWSSDVHSYNHTGFPAAGDGMRVERLVHERDGDGGHAGDLPEQCFLCGQNVAATLRRLGIGVPGSKIHQRDVFILSKYLSSLRARVTDDANTTTADCDLVRGVRSVHDIRHDDLDVRVMADPQEDKARWEREVDEMTEATRDVIVATEFSFVHGMERKVVVVVLTDEDPWLSYPYLMIFAGSRATAQLVVVTNPDPSDSSDAGSSDTDRSDTDWTDTEWSDTDNSDTGHGYTTTATSTTATPTTATSTTATSTTTTSTTATSTTATPTTAAPDTATPDAVAQPQRHRRHRHQPQRQQPQRQQPQRNQPLRRQSQRHQPQQRRPQRRQTH